MTVTTPAPATQDGKAQEDKPPKTSKAVGKAKNWIDSVIGSWSQFVTAAGAVGVALVGYQLTTDLGAGELTGDADYFWTIVSVLAFGVGAGLLLTIPTTLQT